MRTTQSGAIHAHSKSIQTQEREWRKAGGVVNPHQRLLDATRQYLAMLNRWDDGSPDVRTARAACRNLLERLEGGL